MLTLSRSGIKLANATETRKRNVLAQKIATGLAGWFQFQLSQNLADSIGEDAAKLAVAQIVNAQGTFSHATSQKPPNWGTTSKRVDIALKVKSKSSDSWLGAIEIKWAGASFDPHISRLAIVQDALRLSFIETSNLNAKFLVLGGTSTALHKLFDKPHNVVKARERAWRMINFRLFLMRGDRRSKGKLTNGILKGFFSGYSDRVPPAVFGTFDGRLRAELVGKSDCYLAGKTVGHVYVWQCSRTRGSAG